MMNFNLILLFYFVISIDNFPYLVYVIFNWVIFSLSRDDFYGFFKNPAPAKKAAGNLNFFLFFVMQGSSNQHYLHLFSRCRTNLSVTGI